MTTITDKHAIEQIQAELLPRLVNDWAPITAGDGDKVALTQLTPQVVDEAVTFEEADTTLVCQKIYAQPLDPEAIPTLAMEKLYSKMLPHVHYIGQITSVLR